MPNDFFNLLRESLPDAIGGLITAAILAILGALSVKFKKRAVFLITPTVLVIIGLVLAGIDIWIAILGASGIIAFLSCSYLAFKLKWAGYSKTRRRDRKATKIQKICQALRWRSWAICGKYPWKYPNLRLWALSGLLIIPLVTVAGIYYLYSPPG